MIKQIVLILVKFKIINNKNRHLIKKLLLYLKIFKPKLMISLGVLNYHKLLINI